MDELNLSNSRPLKPCKCGNVCKIEYYPPNSEGMQRFSIMCIKCKFGIVNNMQGLTEAWNRRND